jgi:hypothetical protein
MVDHCYCGKWPHEAGIFDMVTRDDRLAVIYAWLFTIIGLIGAAFGTWLVLLGGSWLLVTLGSLTTVLTQLCRIARAKARIS